MCLPALRILKPTDLLAVVLQRRCRSVRPCLCIPSSVEEMLTGLPHLLTGLVFLAFGFNMVDCGGLLGGRLGANQNAAATLKKAQVRQVEVKGYTPPMVKRTFTL